MSHVIAPGSTIGILGGGQLGRMMALAASKLGYKTHIYAPEEHSPAFYSSTLYTRADYDDETALIAFAQSVDVVTVEFENIPRNAVDIVTQHVPNYPSADTLYIAQNRQREKDFINALGIATARYGCASSAAELLHAYTEIGAGKAIIKTLEQGYDGKGQYTVHHIDDVHNYIASHDVNHVIIEAFIPFEYEISVIVARNTHGEISAYPPALNTHVNGILDTSVAPAPIHAAIAKEAQKAATTIITALDMAGLLAIEFFVQKDGTLLVNEMAPRPHNSGHWTQDGAFTCQFEQVLRAICGLPLGNTDCITPITMKNLIGEDVNTWPEIINNPSASLHLYGKHDVRTGRKMGHVNFIGHSA